MSKSHPAGPLQTLSLAPLRDSLAAHPMLAAGMLCVGPIDDKVGRKAVIWFSSLGAALCTLLKPHVDLFCTL